MENHVIDLFAQLETANDPSRVFEISTEYFGKFGFDAVNIGLASASDSTFIGGFSNMCPDFILYYIENEYPVIDPHLKYCYENDTERICDLDSNLRLPHAQSNVVRKLFHEVVDAGQISSLLIPRRSLCADRLVAINLVSNAKSSDLSARYEQDRDAIMVGAALIQTALLEAVEGDRFGEFWYPIAVDNERLTTREREVLNWLANGSRVDQIGHALGIANVTVNFHIQSAKKKLGARTREQAVAMALRKRVLDSSD